MSDKKTRPVIAIDGPAGAGKSTVAKGVATALSFVRVDTGALYRGIALAALEHGVAWDDEEAVVALAGSVALGFSIATGEPRLTLDGVDREDDVRTPKVSEGASVVSRHPGVRAALLDIQRNLGRNGGVVLEGRDIGTVVFPNAEVKVFLTASAEARAKRRVLDLKERGIEEDYDDVLQAIVDRDDRDKTRDIAPLRAADDATVLDSTELNIDEVIAAIVRLAREN